jgi:acetyl esterase/lipase
VVVTIHGGGWQTGTDARETMPFAQDLVQDGIAVWNVEYQLVDAGGGWPTTLADVGTAIDMLSDANVGGRLDLKNIVAFGASAGGHLAAWAASRHKIPAGPGSILSGPPAVRPRGAVAYAAPLDLVYDSDNYGASTALLGGTPQRLPDRYAVSSPYALLPIGVPVVCLHGDADQVIPLEQSQRYVDRAKRLGDPATLITLPGIDHPNTNPVRVGEDLWTRAKAEILKLLGR